MQSIIIVGDDRFNESKVHVFAILFYWKGKGVKADWSIFFNVLIRTVIYFVFKYDH